MPLVTFDDRNATDLLNVNTYNTTTTGTNNVTQNKYWEVVGDGIAIVSVSMNTNSVSDTGSMRSYIYLNGNTVAINGNRFVSATSEVQACNASIALQVSDGDKIRAQQVTTKNGAKTFYWNVLCIGCSVTETRS